MEILPQQFRVPEIYGDYWFNSDPITLSAHRGYVIFLDFWDYTCIKCLHELPYIKEWYKRYTNAGLITISIHTPQFPFARDPVNVRKAIEKFNVNYPVVMDNDYLIWSEFRCISKPTKVLVDKNGFIRYIHAGSGQYQNFEHAIQSLLKDTGYNYNLPFIMEPLCEIDRPGTLCFKETQDILTGWQRGTIGNIEGYSPESTVHYDDPKIYISDRIYLDGDWFNDRNYIKLETSSPNGGSINLIYHAKDVNAIIKSEGESEFQVYVEQDDKPLARRDAGSDIRFNDEGRSYFVVNDARLYNIVLNREFGEHKLKLSTRSNGFSIYSLSFTTSVIPELITES